MGWVREEREMGWANGELADRLGGSEVECGKMKGGWKEGKREGRNASRHHVD